jgi:homoserine dehydrogenase
LTDGFSTRYDPSVREIGVGLLGLGNVGSGVLKLLSDNAEAIERRLGARVVVRKVAVREAEKRRLVEVDKKLLTTRATQVIDDPGVEILVELIGGEDPAREYVRRAIEAKKHVVTANKLLLAMHGDELFALAEKHGRDLYYEASVCGGLPIIRALREGLASDTITEIYGIVNGTSNYTLTTMTDEGKPFDDVLRDAQEAGYAEADPALDVDGGDASHKLAILMMLCFGTRVRHKDIYVEGIRHLTPADFAYAERFGYIVKPLVIAKEHPDGLEARVHPTMIPRRWLLAAVSGVNNAVYVSSNALGQSMYYGRGAGMMPTAVAVVADIIEIARNMLAGVAGSSPTRSHSKMAEKPIRDIGLLRSRYYLRFSVLDRPGVLAQLAGILGEHGISIQQVIQEGSPEPNRPVTVVMLTHVAVEKNVSLALAAIDRLTVVVDKTRLVRISE